MGEENIIGDLIGTSKKRKQQATRKLVNSDLRGKACRDLLEMLQLKCSSTGNNWEVKCRIIEVLGILECEESREILLSLISTDIEYDAVKTEASMAFFRIFRENLNDVSSIWFLAEGTYAVREGALDTLGYDRMVPNNLDCQRIINEFWSFGKGRPSGLGDPRYGLAAAMAGWPLELCRLFLLDCLEADDVPLNYVAKNALEGKYVTLR